MNKFNLAESIWIKQPTNSIIKSFKINAPNWFHSKAYVNSNAANFNCWFISWNQQINQFKLKTFSLIVDWLMKWNQQWRRHGIKKKPWIKLCECGMNKFDEVELAGMKWWLLERYSREIIGARKNRLQLDSTNWIQAAMNEMNN